jgi:hypothetical protein
MIVGLSVSAFTTLHVIITLIAIVAGFVVLFGMLGSKRLPGWTAIFLLFTVLTTVTGFIFLQNPAFRNGVTPAIATGIIATVFFAVALYALYVKDMVDAWRWLYVAAAVVSLYLNVFVLITQSFQKLNILNPLAPQAGPPFAEPTNTYFVAAQGITLAFFIVMGFIAVQKFRPGLAAYR